MSVFIIRPGDLVVCVDARLPENVTTRHRLCKDRLEEGAIYRVSAVVWLYGEKGLHLEGKDHTPTDGWRACRFRKVQNSKTRHHLTKDTGVDGLSELPRRPVNA